ncbi:hypothetical protein AQV86_03965 [Nanohaloarchaea archaeon SG9]|nr:hypothetical protein AQV86_03965 [Nanohaloarchaea archaeon SG9]
MKKKLQGLLLLTVIASGCNVNTASPATETKTKVTDVIDGDTVEINLNGTVEKVRLLGVDTPEVHVKVKPGKYRDIPDTERTRKCLRKWGEKASQYAKNKLSGKNVEFKTDPLSDTRGNYGRILGYVKTNDTNFNHRLVEKGLAQVYESDFSQLERFQKAEKEAQEQLKGLWQCRSYEVQNLTVEQK